MALRIERGPVRQRRGSDVKKARDKRAFEKKHLQGLMKRRTTNRAEGLISKGKKKAAARRKK